MKVSSFLNELRYQLNDIEGLGYPEPLLLEFLNDGLRLVYELKPQHFAHSQVVRAKYGTVQCLDDCFDRLISVDAVCDKNGNSVGIIRQASVKMAEAFDKAPINYHAYHYTIRDEVRREFTVYPPVHQEMYWRITCTTPPNAVVSAEDDLTYRFHEALLHYALYRAYSLETESVSSSTLAQQHQQQFYQLLQIKKAINDSSQQDNRSA